MNSLKFLTRFKGLNKCYLAEAVIVDHVPAEGEIVWYCGTREVVDAILPAWIDPEQPRREVQDFDVFEIHVHDEDDAESAGYRYIAVRKTEK